MTSRQHKLTTQQLDFLKEKTKFDIPDDEKVDQKYGIKDRDHSRNPKKKGGDWKADIYKFGLKLGKMCSNCQKQT